MTDLPEYTETLNDLMAKKASEWTPEILAQIVEGLRTQRERWNAEQALGSRKLVKSSKVPVGAPKTIKLAIKGLKL